MGYCHGDFGVGWDLLVAETGNIWRPWIAVEGIQDGHMDGCCFIFV